MEGVDALWGLCLGINGLLGDLLLGNTPCGSLLLLHTYWVCGNPAKPCLLFPWVTSQDCVCRKSAATIPTRKSKLAARRGAHTSVPASTRLRRQDYLKIEASLGDIKQSKFQASLGY